MSDENVEILRKLHFDPVPLKPEHVDQLDRRPSVLGRVLFVQSGYFGRCSYWPVRLPLSRDSERADGVA